MTNDPQSAFKSMRQLNREAVSWSEDALTRAADTTRGRKLIRPVRPVRSTPPIMSEAERCQGPPPPIPGLEPVDPTCCSGAHWSWWKEWTCSACGELHANLYPREAAI